MTRGQDSLRRLISHKRPQSMILCRKCLSDQRHNSMAASPIKTTPNEISSISRPSPSPLTSTTAQPHHYKIKAAVLLSRPPLLTRDLTPFEKAHFLYQRRLNERLALPFTRYFYYQRGTPGDVEWKRKIKERLTPARDIGKYSGYGEESWNDEVLVGDEASEPEVQRQQLVKDAEVEVKGREDGAEVVKKEVAERPMSRWTEADEKGDRSSLNRLLTRTLYLMVKRGKSEWILPGHELLRDESLHTAAERIIVQTAGINMNTWVVGNMPIGHQVHKYSKPIVDQSKDTQTLGEKIFYMKARIMAGKPNLKDNKLDLSEYQWLAKDEIETTVHPREWSAVKNILAER